MKRQEAYLDIQTFLADNYVSTVAQSEEEENWRELLRDIEENGWLAWQAEILGGFEVPSRELEEYILPYLLEQRDWERFVRHAATAAQLRGMAETLEEGPVLRALAEAGHLRLAEELAARLPDPLRRARARAEMAVGLRTQSRSFGNLIKRIEEDLESMEGSEAETEIRLLIELARLLGGEMQATLGPLVEWLAGRHPGKAGSLWRALAVGRFTPHELDAFWLWKALRAIEKPEDLPRLWPSPEQYEPWLRKIADELEDAEMRWWLALPALEASVSGGGEQEAWTTAWQILGPCPTSLEWVEVAWKVWPALSEEQTWMVLDRLEPLSRVALRVARVDCSSPSQALDELGDAIEALPPGEEQLHLALRCLEQSPREPQEEHRGRLAAVARHLVHIRYRAPDSDLGRYLDLVAQAHDEKILRRQVESVLWAPASSAETLRHLVEHAGSDALLEELFEKSEEYAAMAAETSAEGFELRREVLVTLAARLCGRREDRTFFDQAWERLLPEETDDLAEAVAESLAEGVCRDLAGEIAQKISAGPRRLRTLLEVRPPDLDLEELLSPAGLYAAVADPRPVVDEVRSLSVLLETPDPPEEVQAIAREHLDEVTDPGRRIEALVDLARHAMSCQEDHTPKRLRDFPAAIAPLKQALGVVPSNDWLLGITPELVEVGARLGPAHAVAEVQEAWERVMELEDVDVAQRDEALHWLLERIPRLFSEGGETRRVRRLLDWVEGRIHDMEGETERLRVQLQALRDGMVAESTSGDDSVWLHVLAQDLRAVELDASDPRTMPLRRRLWQVDRDRALPILAKATVQALGAGGMEGGENALRWFVNAYLAPKIGKSGEQDGRRSELRAALDRSRSIGSEDTWSSVVPLAEAAPRHDRLSRIERRILTSEKLQPQQSPWGRLRSGRGGAMLLVVLFASLLLFAVDGEYLAWWTGQPSPEPTSNSLPSGGGPLLWMGLALGAAQAWAIRRFEWLMPTAANEARLPRLVHDLLAMIPFWGPGVLMAPVHRVSANDPRFRLDNLSNPPPRFSPGHRLAVNEWVQAGFLMLGYVWLFISLLWLLQRSATSAGFRYALLGVALGLHLLTALAFLVHLCNRRRQLLATPSIFYFIPVALLFPVAPLFVLFAWLFIDKNAREQALCARLRFHRRERWDTWHRFRRHARAARKRLSWWKRLRGGASKPVSGEGRLATQWRYAERIKTCFVFLDAAALAWGAHWLVGRGWLSLAEVDDFLGFLAVLALFMTGLATVALLGFWMRELLGSPSYPFGIHGTVWSSFLVGCSWGVVAGLALGQALYENNVETAGAVLVFTGAVGALLFFSLEMLGLFISVPQRAETGQYRHLRSVLFAVLALYGMGLVAPPQDLSVPQISPETQVGLLEIFVLCSPAFSATIGGALVMKLVPDRWKPSRRRAILLTAFAPLGGLAVPLWQVWRAREDHRWEPAEIQELTV